MLGGDTQVEAAPAGSGLARPVAASAPNAAVERRKALRESIRAEGAGRWHDPGVELAGVYHGARAVVSTIVPEGIPLTPS